MWTLHLIPWSGTPITADYPDHATARRHYVSARDSGAYRQGHIYGPGYGPKPIRRKPLNRQRKPRE